MGKHFCLSVFFIGDNLLMKIEDLDLFFSGFTYRLFEQVGDKLFEAKNLPLRSAGLPGSSSAAGGAKWGDWNADGFPDLLYHPSDQAELFVWASDGGSSFRTTGEFTHLSQQKLHPPSGYASLNWS